MKLDLKNTSILSVAVLSLSGCINEDTSPCPPLSMVFDVQERTYSANKDCPPGFVDPNEGKIFGELIPTLYCILRDYNTGEVVREKHMIDVDNNEQTHTIVFDEDLPYGKYILTSWGGLDDESQLKDIASTLDLTDLEHEMYLTNDTIDYNYGCPSSQGHFMKVNGLVVIETDWETFPKGFNSSDKIFSGVQSTVNTEFEYSDIQNIEVVLKDNFDDASQKWISETVLPPSRKVDGTRLHIKYYKSSDPEAPGIVPDDIYLTVRRNSITYIKYTFDPYINNATASIFVNGQWQEINNMSVD